MKLSKPAVKPITKPVLEADQPQRSRIKYGQDETQRTLTAHEPADRIVYLARQRPHRLATRRWDPVVDCRDHPVPVIDKVAGNDRGHDSQREDREQFPSS